MLYINCYSRYALLLCVEQAHYYVVSSHAPGRTQQTVDSQIRYVQQLAQIWRHCCINKRRSKMPEWTGWLNETKQKKCQVASRFRVAVLHLLSWVFKATGIALWVQVDRLQSASLFLRWIILRNIKLLLVLPAVKLYTRRKTFELCLNSVLYIFFFNLSPAFFTCVYYCSFCSLRP